NTKRVTIPNWPAPPPRHAQYRSGWFFVFASSSWPLAIAIVTERTLSQVRPNFRPEKPCPPPRASPAIPTVGHEPAGIATPCSDSLSSTPTSRAPAPTLAVPFAPFTATAFIHQPPTAPPVVREYPP